MPPSSSTRALLHAELQLPCRSPARTTTPTPPLLLQHLSPARPLFASSPLVHPQLASDRSPLALTSSAQLLHLDPSFAAPLQPRRASPFTSSSTPTQRPSPSASSPPWPEIRQPQPPSRARRQPAPTIRAQPRSPQLRTVPDAELEFHQIHQPELEPLRSESPTEPAVRRRRRDPSEPPLFQIRARTRGNLESPSRDIGETESSAPTAEAVPERPVEEEVLHDTGFEEQGYISAPSFSGSDLRLLVDMLTEQTTKEATGPSFESDSFTVPVMGTDSVMIPGISSLPRSDGPTGPAIETDTLMTSDISHLPEGDGLAGPAVMTDATTVSGIDILHNGGVSTSQPRGTTDLPTEIDIPSTITPAIVLEPVETRPPDPIVRPQSVGTSIGIGSQPSPYGHILALLSDSDPSRDIFRMDLNSFVFFFNDMIEKVLHQGYRFDQFGRSLSRYMTMIRDEGYSELADSLTADFIILESELRDLEELKARGISSFVSSRLEPRVSQWRDMRSSISSELQSYEHSVAQLMASIARKDTDRAALLSSLDSNREEVSKLKKALKLAEESSVIMAEELAGLESSCGQTLERLGSTQERLMKLKNEAAKILSSSEESIRADLQAELEQSYTDSLSKLESHVLSRRLPSG